MAPNPNDKKYGNYNCGDHQTNDTVKHAYNKQVGMDSLGMSQHVMSNSSSNDGIVRKNLIPSVASQDIEYHKPFAAKEHYDSASIKNVSGKIFSCTCDISNKNVMYEQLLLARKK